MVREKIDVGGRESRTGDIGVEEFKKFTNQINVTLAEAGGTGEVLFSGFDLGDRLAKAILKHREDLELLILLHLPTSAYISLHPIYTVLRGKARPLQVHQFR